MLAFNHLSKPIEIHHFQTDSTNTSVQKHDFHELLFILKGKGSYFKNEVHTAFSSGDLFLIKKNDPHEFVFVETSELYLLQFNDEIKRSLKYLVDNSKGKAVAPLKAKSPMHLKISCAEKDQGIVLKIFKLLLELQKNEFTNINIMHYQVLCLIQIIERNLSLNITNSEDKKTPQLAIQSILKHIHKNLYDPELLTLQAISEKFNLTKNKLGNYFKQETKISVKQYIIQCRMKIIKEKIINGKQSFSEIAYEFGFTDESHFYKT